MDHPTKPALSLANFQQALDQSLTLCDDQGNTQTLKVTQVRDWTGEGAPYETFSVLLECEQSQTLEQGVYLLNHQAIGQQALMCVPVSEREYEVVVSRELAD